MTQIAYRLVYDLTTAISLVHCQFSHFCRHKTRFKEGTPSPRIVINAWRQLTLVTSTERNSACAVRYVPVPQCGGTGTYRRLGETAEKSGNCIAGSSSLYRRLVSLHNKGDVWKAGVNKRVRWKSAQGDVLLMYYTNSSNFTVCCES